MKKKVIYIADDGVEFYNEDECKLYEKYAIKEIKEKISALLGNIEPNYFFKYSIIPHKVEDLLSIIDIICESSKKYSEESGEKKRNEIEIYLDKIRNENIAQYGYVERMNSNWVKLRFYLSTVYYRFISSIDVNNIESSYLNYVVTRLGHCSVLTGNEYTCAYYAIHEDKCVEEFNSSNGN